MSDPADRVIELIKALPTADMRARFWDALAAYERWKNERASNRSRWHFSAGLFAGVLIAQLIRWIATS